MELAEALRYSTLRLHRGGLPLIKMPLKTDEGIAYSRHATKQSRRITDGPVFQLQQMRQFGLIQLAVAFFHVLGEDKIQKRLKLVIVV
jgi:hypothetical protein